MQSGRSNQGGQPRVDVAQSTLKADAAVFVPRFAPAPQPQQVRAAPVQPQRTTHRYPGFNPNNGTPRDWLEYAASLIADTPGAFEDIMIPLTQCLNKCLVDSVGKHELIALHIQDIVEFIFQRSVMDAQFRYNGARMCNHFVHHLVNKDFKSVLVKRCQQEHQKKAELLDNPLHMLGFTLCMGEMMTNVKHEDQKTPMKFLAGPVMELLNMLLDNPKEPCIKCAFQLLKMTGALLEDKEKEDNDGKTESLDAIFVKINALLAKKDLDRRQRNMLECVVQHRDNDWYRKKREEEEAAVNEARTNGAPKQAMFVADDGTVFFSAPPQSVRNRGGYEVSGGAVGAVTPSNYNPPPPPAPPAESPNYYGGQNFYSAPQHDQMPPAMMGGANMPPNNMMGGGSGNMPPNFQEMNEMNALIQGMQGMPADLQQQMMQYPPGEGDYPQYAPVEEMDDEIAAAFEVFLKDTQQK